MANWKYLQPGDIVDVVAPSSWCASDDLKTGVAYLESLGLVVRIPKNLIKQEFVYANSVPDTLKILKNAFYNTESKAVWCLRGGSGGFRIVPHLLNWRKPKNTKLFVGISDITFMHIFLNQKWNWPTLHAPMISMLAKGKSSKKEKKDLEKVIFGYSNVNVFNRLISLNKAASRNKKIKGKVVGGNLCIVESTIGTKYASQFQNKIVFLEDIDERGYALERSLEHMRNAGSFKGVRAVVFGDFVGGQEKDGKDLTLKALRRFAERSEFPVMRGIQSGHGPLVRSLPLNTDSELFLGKKGTLICSTGGHL